MMIFGPKENPPPKLAARERAAYSREGFYGTDCRPRCRRGTVSTTKYTEEWKREEAGTMLLA